MVDFRGNYRQPGVYIEEEPTTLTVSTGIPPTLVALVGPSLGYQTHVEQVVLSEDGARLVKQGIDLDTIVVDDEVGELIASSEYEAVASASTTNREHYVDLSLAADSDIDDGTLALVTYRYTVPDYFSPRRFDDFESVKSFYGEPLNLSVPTVGQTDYVHVGSPLSLAAQIAFENGAGDLVCVPATPPGVDATTDSAKSTARRAALAAGYVKIATDYAINVVVPVTTGILAADAVGTIVDLRTHLSQSTTDGYRRTGIIGFDPVVTTAPDALLATASVAFSRLMLAYGAPGGLLAYNGSANTTFALGHQYLAAAYAGREAALTPEESLTKQIITSFIGLAGTPLANSLKNQYAAAGVALVEVDRFGRLTVRHGVTTDVSNASTREMSVVRAKDALIGLVQDGTASAGLIGQPIVDDTVLSVKSTVSGLLEFAVDESLVVDYSGLTARVASTDPSVIEVKFAYRPAYPLNFIVISFSIDLSQGIVTADTDDEIAAA